ncbi:RT0821/Lpp0805 family surface protein [Bdellovibrio sp. HCB337]|uniref:RT0821/Lpp0805 family surface protein n=1 Tax=Bdellovibrio sp. HCB337 TaxID=3394358 RepID=UPI0039A66366
MKKQAILGTLIAATVLQTSVPAYAGKEEVGNIVGGIIGGVIGSQIGGGSGKTAATIIGAIAGSMIGGQVGRDMEEADRRALEDAQRNCLNNERVGSSVEWDGARYGSRSGAHGRFTAVREGYNYRTGEYCREYESSINLYGRQERTTGIACSRADGSWYESNYSEVRYDNSGLDRHRPPRYPGPGRPQPGRPGRPPVRPGPIRPTPPPPPPNYGQYQGSVQVNAITRRTGGAWYRLTLHRPLSLTNIELRVLRANVRLHEAALVTDYNQRLPIYELSNTPVLGTNTVVGSYINRNERIVAIDIRAESYGAYSDILVNVTSPEDYPYLSVTQF